jgi:hypothetical protein
MHMQLETNNEYGRDELGQTVLLGTSTKMVRVGKIHNDPSSGSDGRSSRKLGKKSKLRKKIQQATKAAARRRAPQGLHKSSSVPEFVGSVGD